ncbi:MAG TPA: serine protease [Hyphomonadaceae bacterium]|nr:serine protease [Hyphomonadaceae bacterium]HPN06479.1 serine protease [Hyphomonadaceae bacterium]
MRIPDWVVYAVVLVVIVGTLFSSGSGDKDKSWVFREEAVQSEPEFSGRGRTPAASDSDALTPRSFNDEEGLPLPDSDPFDERVLVQVGDAEDGIGTAFAINQSGAWLTARHVVDGCSRVGLAVGGGRMVKVDAVRTSPKTDLALLLTDRAPTSLPLALDRELRIGEPGYHVGFPQGRSGEAVSVLESRSNLVTRGRYAMEEPVLAWSEQERSDGIEGTLSGMSGGPVFDKDGAVIGVTVAESPRRNRIYTASPDSIRNFLEEQGLVAPGGEAHALSAASYSQEANRLRAERAVVKVLCRVGEDR